MTRIASPRDGRHRPYSADGNSAGSTSRHVLFVSSVGSGRAPTSAVLPELTPIAGRWPRRRFEQRQLALI
jgi:hypothetical protein